MGKCPTIGKKANLIPIYKNCTDLGNYIPVSLTSIKCKIMESIIRDKLELFIENNNILRDSQHGLRKCRSCLTNFLAFFEEATKCFDVSSCILFDKVPHNCIIKMRTVGITGAILEWVRNWVQDRTQRVVVGGTLSELGIVGSGVPQGPVLGPMLFPDLHKWSWQRYWKYFS